MRLCEIDVLIVMRFMFYHNRKNHTKQIGSFILLNNLAVMITAVRKGKTQALS